MRDFGQKELKWALEKLLGLGRAPLVTAVLAMCFEREAGQDHAYLQTLNSSFPLQLTALVWVPQELIGLSPFRVHGTPGSWTIQAGPTGGGGLAHSSVKQAGDLERENLMEVLYEVTRLLPEGTPVPEPAWISTTYEAWRQAVAFVEAGAEGAELELEASEAPKEPVRWRATMWSESAGSQEETETSEEVAAALFRPIWRLQGRARVVQAGGWSKPVRAAVLEREIEEPTEVLTFPLFARLGLLGQGRSQEAREGAVATIVARLSRQQHEWAEMSQEERQAYLKQWRDERDLSQQEAGALVNRSVRTWQSWELGKRAPSDWLGLQLALLDLKRGD